MRWVSALMILGLGFAGYSVRLRTPYVADDHFIFYRLQEGGAFGFASQPPTSFFRPLISLHYYLDYLLGMSPLFSHGVNLAWHITCGMLLYALAYRLLLRRSWKRERAEFGALIGATVFVVLPANVESVAWFAARADMVAAAGALGALLLLMRFHERGRLSDYLGALLCFTGGLFCKESLLTFPLIVWLWLRYLGTAAAGRRAIPFFGVLIAYLVARTVVVGGAGAYPEAWETLQRPWLLVVNLLAYLLQMVMPAILYGLGRDVWDTLLWALWAVGVGLLVYAWRVYPPRRTPQMDGHLVALWVLLALLPVLIFKPSPFYFLNSRYSYLASTFALMGLSAWFASLKQGRWVVSGFAVLLIGYVMGTIRQAEAWAEAGKVARSSVLSLKDAPTDQPLLILSVPDHFHGAYIWREGFHEGVALLLPERANQPIAVASRFTMRLKTDVAVDYADGVATLSSPNDIFLPPEGVRTPQGDEPIVLPDKLVIHWSVIEQYRLLTFREGGFVSGRNLHLHAEPDSAEVSSMSDYTPKPEHKFTFGLWTVGNIGRDPFGEPTRSRLPPTRIVQKLSELGAWGVNLHDNDLVPIDATPAERDAIVREFKKALEDHNMRLVMGTTNLFSDPAFKDGAFTSNDPKVRAYALQKSMGAIDLAVELGAEIYVFWGGREGTETDAAKDPVQALQWYRECLNFLIHYVKDQGYNLKFALEPKPNEPRGDIFLPTVGAMLAFIETLDDPNMCGVNPEVAHEHMAGLNFTHAVAQAIERNKLFHIDLNAQKLTRYDQDFRFGAEDIKGAFFLVKLLEDNGYSGPRHFDAHAYRTEDEEGVWEFAKGCMRTYLILKEKAERFNQDPEIQELLSQIRQWDVQLQERMQYSRENAEWLKTHSFDRASLGVQGYQYEKLDQLTMELLLGVR